jgi:hypothetical protein
MFKKAKKLIQALSSDEIDAVDALEAPIGRRT